MREKIQTTAMNRSTENIAFFTSLVAHSTQGPYAHSREQIPRGRDKDSQLN